MVTSAVLIRVDGGSKWKLTFEMQGADCDEHSEEAVVSPDGIDSMFFDTTYTLEQIKALRDGA